MDPRYVTALTETPAFWESERQSRLRVVLLSFVVNTLIAGRVELCCFPEARCIANWGRLGSVDDRTAQPDHRRAIDRSAAANRERATSVSVGSAATGPSAMTAVGHGSVGDDVANYGSRM